MSLPDGNLTFLFTDIEGSTRLWEQYPEAMRTALARHDALLYAIVQAHGGSVFKTVGDAFCTAFADPMQAVAAALAMQSALQNEAWDVAVLRIRAALHTGWAEERNGDYFGPTLNRVARLLAIGHGGQTLVSATTAAHIGSALPAGVSLRDMDRHRLKDLQQPEHVFQLLHPDLPEDFPPLRSLNLLRHNLPIQMTSFIGRERELADVKRQLADARLLTLTGSGGCGKTRLALQAAAEVVEDFADGVWMVELAPLSEPALVPQAIAALLDVREEPGRALTQTLVEFLRPKKLLLVLDNCEHLLTACAQLANTLLRSCPDVKIMAGSREALGIHGEHIYRIPILALPDAKRLPSPEVLLRCESAHLFLERARVHKPAFAVTESNARVLAQVCRQLDGIPLALELAAARLRVMPLEQLADRLEDRFRLLTGGSRTAPPRQQTLRATIDWSYDLLTESERLLMKRLSVFAGGWTLEAAETVAADKDEGGRMKDELKPAPLHPSSLILHPYEVLDLLAGLVDKSLVVYEEQGGAARYRLPGTLRQYSVERLEESGESEAARDRHQAFYEAMVTESESSVGGQEAGSRQESLKTEYDNIRVALDWTLLHKDAAQAAAMCIALADFWETRGWFREAYETLQRCLTRLEEIADARQKAQLLTVMGWFCRLRADYECAADYQQRSLALCREAGNAEGEANALNNLALIAQAQGRPSEARDLFVASLEIARRLGDARKQAARLSNLGLLENQAGNYQQAREHLEEARTLYTLHEDAQGMAACLCNLADMALRQQDGAEAERLSQQCRDLFERLEYQPGIASALANLAEAALLRKDYAAADAHIREAMAICAEIEMQELMPLLLAFQAESRAAQGDEEALRLSAAQKA